MVCLFTVYFSWPTLDTPKWQLLGYIGNDKPSSVFKVSGLKKNPSDCEKPTFLPTTQQVVSPVARIGISVLPVSQVHEQMAILESSKMMEPTQVANYCQKMLESFFNFAGSFAVQQSQMVPNPTESYVPLSAVRTWYDNFLKKLTLNPNFWRT